MNQTKFILISLLTVSVIAGLYYIHSINKIRKVVENPVIDTSRIMVEININRGFIIHTPYSETSREYKWTDFDSVVLKDQQEVVFKSKNQIVLELHKNKIDNWIEVILSIPKNIIGDESLKNEKKKITEQLSTCQICGRIGVINDNCLNCGNLSVEKHLSEYGKYQNSKDYIYQNQEYWFRQENGEIDLDFDEPNVFEKDENWKISVE